jgi:hypothetical protein
MPRNAGVTGLPGAEHALTVILKATDASSI